MIKIPVALGGAVGAGAIVGVLVGSIILSMQLGQPINGADPLSLITHFPGWTRAFAAPFSKAYIAVPIAIALFVALALILLFQSKLTQYGQAHFQNRAEMKRNGLLQPIGTGLVFGKLGSPKSKAPYISAKFDKFPHCLVVAPTRAGKGVGYVIPNTLLFPGSTVILDVKGEIFEATSRYRQSKGDEIFRFSPFDFDHQSHRYNPLERIARIEKEAERYTELAKLADYFLTVSDKGSAGDFLSEGRTLFIAAGMLAIERKRPTIGEISRIIFGGGNKQVEYAKHAQEVQAQSAKGIFLNFSGYNDRTLTSHASVLGGAGLSLWNNPAVDAATNGNDFSFLDVRRKPMSIYVCVDSDDIPTLAPLIRLFFGELIATIRGTMPDHEKEPWPVLILLDEFDQLGAMPIVEQALKQIAGHGARVSIITQSVPGLDNIYGENVRLSLEAAAGMKLYLAANERKTASEVSGALGKTTKLAVSDSISRDGNMIQRRSVSRRTEERPLMTEDEIRRLDPNVAILIPERQHPLMVKRIKYYEDPTFLVPFKSQKGPLPYPRNDDYSALRQEFEELKRQVATGALRYDAPTEQPAEQSAPVVQAVAAQTPVAATAPSEPTAAAAVTSRFMPPKQKRNREEAATEADTDVADRMASFLGKIAKN